MEQIPQKIIDYINENRAPLPPLTDPDEPLQFDSLGLTRLVLFMESDCGIRVENEDLVPENLATMRSLVALIAKKSQHAAPRQIPRGSSQQPAEMQSLTRSGTIDQSGSVE